ncbi:MAG: ABC transporter permease [Candidatus Izemoplasmatales bacterium]|nr:ABC transporter permease [Candidatus Izemoplasmatales bacterium]MDD4354878.1 ABC transporter permease [Candidatus Izemoplasmatales bacterium]MDD4987716.1 ABC transporter permease [Candidatus Izemoplasmatales bacterium]MDD5602000.1 ABC transporter permease [Candidatus Izemoplasmatales bacterium]MDY0372965.1 ABC transporter permease [Candidatus Izemoplasmatales bacterium]
MIYNLIKRNMKLYFRDRTSVMFSLLGVIIIIGLYVLFLGNMLENALANVPQIGLDKARFLLDSWIMGGVIASTSITTCMGAFGIMVDDNVKHIIKDFKISPMKRWQMVLAYIISSVIIGMIMSVFTFILAEIYIIINGGQLLPLLAILKVLGLIVVSVSSSSAVVFFLISFIKTQNAFGTASTLLGTLIGFLMGIYIPIGNLPEAVQVVIKIFPMSHSAVLIRQVMMAEAIPLANLPEELLLDLGANYEISGSVFPVWAHIAVLLVTLVVFYFMAILVASRKKERE